MKPRGQFGTYLALVAVQIFFGLNYLAAKVALAELEPRALAALRVTGGAIALLLIARASGRQWPREARTYGRLALLSAFGIVANQVLFIEGLSRTTSTHSALINTSIPVATLIFAVLAGRERVTLRKLLAFLLSTVGVVLVIRPWTATGLTGMMLGDLLTLSNAMSFSLFLVLSKPLMSRADPLAASAVLMAFGAIGIDLLAIPQLAVLDVAAISATTWLLLGYIVLFPTAGAYWLQYWALTRVDSSVVALFIYMQPIIATTLSVLLLGDRPAPVVLLGGGLIFLGVYLALRRRRARSAAGPAR